jgi:hypothetical protein
MGVGSQAWRALAARLGALYIGNARRETLLGCAKDLLFAVERIATMALPFH